MASNARSGSASSAHMLSAAQRETYHRDGFVIVPGLLAADEVAPIAAACREDPSIGGAICAIADSSGNAQDFVQWTERSDDLIGLMPYIARLVLNADALIGREVYHWHSKFVMKPPKSAGRFDWHQDYGYWYYEGCLLPDMLTAMIAVDAMDRENGGLQLLRGSHKMGRLDVQRVGAASGADTERLALAKARYELVHCELAPGDAIFFDALTLHASGANPSTRSRTALHCSYSAADNAPFTDSAPGHRYRPIEVLPDDMIRAGRWSSVFRNHEFIKLDVGGAVHGDSPISFQVVDPVTRSPGGGAAPR